MLLIWRTLAGMLAVFSRGGRRRREEMGLECKDRRIWGDQRIAVLSSKAQELASAYYYCSLAINVKVLFEVVGKRSRFESSRQLIGLDKTSED
jgi:hypothetical protein